MQKRNAIISWGIVTVLSASVAVGLNNLLLLINLAQYSKRYREAAEILYSPSFSQQILYNGLLIPVIEEVLFRGILFRVLRKWCSFQWAMLVSAIVFGLYHGNLVQFVYATICGFLLAHLYEEFGSVFMPIWSHMAMNIGSIVLTQIGAFTWMMESSVKTIAITIICVGITVWMLRLLQKGCYRSVKNILQRCV